MAVHRRSFIGVKGSLAITTWLFIGAVDVPFMDMAIHRRWIWLFIGAVDVKGFVWKKKIE
ncbi:hypothetical protein SO802_030625 [Lithocarpus litseifolius]|uniref:Uncharacterized protein n=1 Tax=Lithocarpus litseifolius TaxID=425828 RepID=A0AAW2BI24_9ROSI